MAVDPKLSTLKTILGITDADTVDVNRLTAYLDSAKAEIIGWRYGTWPEEKRPVEVPPEYEQIQIWAVVAGFSQSGAENQTSHSENGISRTFKYEDMIAYIRSKVTPYVGVL